MAGHGCLGLGLFCWVLLAVPVGPQPASSVPGAPLTTLTPPPQSEASMLSLNLGLNFKFHLRGPAAAWGSPVTETQSLSIGPSRELEGEVASGLKTDPLWELLMGSLGNSPPEWGSAEGSSTPWASSQPLESTSVFSGPTGRPTAPYQPRIGTWDTALMATAPQSSAPRPHQSELELKFDMALRAGAAPTLGHRTLPLLPSLRASLAEIAGRLGPFGFFGTTLSPLRNFSVPSPPGLTTSPSSASGVSSDSPGFFGTTLSPPPSSLERKLPSPGPRDPTASLSSTSIATASLDPTIPTSGPDDPSPASFGITSTQPECGPRSCSIGELPEGEGQPPAAPLPLFFLTLEADWAEARARWGLAWEAHVYGARSPFAPRESWRRAARTAPVAGTFGLLSGALQGYEVLHALGYGGQPGLEGPWPWWAFQLGLRLGEVGVALPLALLGLYPALCSPRVPPRCWAKLFRLSPGHAAPLLPGRWVTVQRDKEPLGSAIARGDAELLQLCALAGPGPDLLFQGGARPGFEGRAANPAPSPASSPCSDYTVDFRPPSPINLRRSIEEALGSESLLAPGLFQGPAFGEALPGLGLYSTATLRAKTRPVPSGMSEEAPGSPVLPELPSPGAWPAGSSASSGSLCGLSRDSSSMLLCSSPDRPPRCPLVCVLSPPRPSGSSPSLPASGSYQALSPPSHDSPEPSPELQVEEALLQEQFLDACRQIDELSMGSDTIDL
ncbi:PREDICTED: proline-rich transmembrane protein 4 isoform X2 [Hipposideros armiger]|uniref:Proline-rich transmembrane protein 4 isoform X2 n=1 Tax=Hipposideros armiger TaxID=186990 RepID=A0A8B7RKV1_HIPAR|nr:PREDICTED: proline-rich transmembrane protein 4 isoform X2 [Hipposideros armiger]